MSAAARVLAAARAAGVEVARRGHGLYVKSQTKPSTDILEALRQHKPTILELLDAERCAHCQRQGSNEKPLLECAYAGVHPLLLHRDCIQSFMASDAAASPCYAPRVVCDYCGLSGGRLENIGFLGGPVGGVPVHLSCAAAWFARLDAIRE